MFNSRKKLNQEREMNLLDLIEENSLLVIYIFFLTQINLKVLNFEFYELILEISE